MRHERTDGRVLLVMGSTHPATRAQQEYLRAENLAAIVESDVPPAQIVDAWRRRAHLLLRVESQPHAGTRIRAALAAVPRGELAGVVLSGGDTAADACTEIGVEAIRLGGEVNTGIPWGVLSGGVLDEVPAVLKSGAFGSVEALAAAVDFLSSRRI